MRRRLASMMERGSLSRHLILHLLPPVAVLVLVDLGITWIVATQLDLQVWLLRDIFWVMLISQILLMALFAWALLSAVRSGLASINVLSEEINQRSVDDLRPLNIPRLSAEIIPVVNRLNDLLLRLNDSVQAQKRFVGHAAHQLRTPLAGLKMESELMLAKELPDDVRKRAERIKSVSDRMIRVGQQLLVLARAETSIRPQDSFQRLDLAEWVRLEGGGWVPKARASQVELRLDAPDEPVWIDGDPLLMGELLGNLIDNALRYGRTASYICLQVSANPPALVVEDDGQGIAAEDQDKVFEAFYRSSRPEADGSGLGMAIVREIARAHGAWWSLTSQPEFAGTRVGIVFPGPRKGANLANRSDSHAAPRAASRGGDAPLSDRSESFTRLDDQHGTAFARRR